MKILVWGINYAPEVIGIGRYTTDLCYYLATCGDRVCVVTGFAYYPSWQVDTKERWRCFRSEELNGVRIWRCWHYVPRRPTVWPRVVHELSFVVNSAVRVLALPPPDVYLVISPPLLLGIVAWIVSIVKRRRFIFHVQDLQPDAAAGLKMVRHGLMLRLLRAIELLVYKKSVLVSAISPEMANAIEDKGLDPTKVITMPNWIDCELRSNLPTRGHFIASRGLGTDSAVVSYAGNFGYKQGLEVLLEAAKVLRHRKDIVFVLAGDGAERQHLVGMKEDYCLDNVLIEALLTDAEHTSLLVDSTLAIITQRAGAGAAFLPSKLLKIAMVGKPVLTNAAPETPLARAVLEGGFGQVVESQRGDGLALHIERILSDSRELSRMSEAAVKYAERFDRSRILPAFRHVLLEHCHRSAADASDLPR